MTRPIKKTGFYQGIYEESSTKKEEIGTLRILQDGRKFRYARAGGTALGKGKMGEGIAAGANVINQAQAATPRGESSLTFTAGGAVTYAQDFFAGGYFMVNDADGEGQSYEIESSSAVTAGTTIYITLRDPLMTALLVTSEASLIHSPWMATVESTTAAVMPAGVPAIDVQANFYYWAQTGGLANVLILGTPGVGTRVVCSTTAGAVTAPGGTYAAAEPVVVGTVFATAGVTTEYKPVFLTLD